MTDYEAAKKVIETRMKAYDWECAQLRDELHDIRNDPEEGRESNLYKSVRRELNGRRSRYWALYDLLETLDDDTRAVINGEWTD